MKKQNVFKSERAARDYLTARGWVYCRTGAEGQIFGHSKVYGYWRALYRDRKGVWKTKVL